MSMSIEKNENIAESIPKSNVEFVSVNISHYSLHQCACSQALCVVLFCFHFAFPKSFGFTISSAQEQNGEDRCRQFGKVFDYQVSELLFLTISNVLF